MRKLLIVLLNTDPGRPEALATPLYHAAVAAAMDIEVDVVCTGPAGRLLQTGVASALRAKAGAAKRIHDWIREAVAHGARFRACPANLGLLVMTAADLIPECSGFMGAAAMIERTLADDTRVLSY